MKYSNLYRVNPDTKTLHNVKEINFSDHNFKERYDIQEWIETKPSILGEKLLIIAKEQAIFEGTNERPDLIAVDTEGNIVIIELKRDDSGADVHWQAIKYASYWSRFSTDDIIETYLQYLKKYHKGDADTFDEAKQKIFDFVDVDTINNSAQRIILVSHRFSKEVISAVEWLIAHHKLDIKCFELIPYFDETTNTYYLQAMLLLPVIGIDDALVKPSVGKSTTSPNINRNKKDDETTKFFEAFKKQLIRSAALKPEEVPTKFSRWAGTTTWFRYYHLWYKKGLWDNWNFSYKIWLYNNHPANNDHKNKFQILLLFYEDYLTKQGINESQIKVLTTLLETVAKEIGFSTIKNKNKNEFSISLHIPNTELNDSAIEEVLSTVVSLISKTYAPVNEILNQNTENSQETNYV